MSVANPIETPTCAFCAQGQHHLCRPDVVPCGCSDSGHPGRGEGPRSLKPAPPLDKATARARLRELRTSFEADRDDQAVRTLDWLIERDGPLVAYRIIFAELERAPQQSLLPPFDPAVLAPPGAHGIPGSHPRGHGYLRSVES